VAAGRHPDQRGQVLGRGGLDQEAGGAGTQRPQYVLVGVEGGQRDHHGRLG
jgi:hypothetical protein